MLITPAKAEEWLNKNKGNRSLRNGAVEKYADDMKNGRWTQCVAPIVFYENGDIADGQHRLYAIVESGKSQRFYVVRGLDKAAGLNIDTGMGRSLVDNGQISGLDTGLSHSLISWAQAVEFGGRGNKGQLSNAQKLELVAKHREAVSWVIRNGPKGRHIRNAVVAAAIARAWYHEHDKDKLHRFANVLSTGMPEGMHESAAVAMRNYLQSRGEAASTTALWKDTFLKVQNCVNYFMRGKQLIVVKTIGEEVYPLLGVGKHAKKGRTGATNK
jgi:hypothetical protein